MWRVTDHGRIKTFTETVKGSETTPHQFEITNFGEGTHQLADVPYQATMNGVVSMSSGYDRVLHGSNQLPALGELMRVRFSRPSGQLGTSSRIIIRIQVRLIKSFNMTAVCRGNLDVRRPCWPIHSSPETVKHVLCSTRLLRNTDTSAGD